VLDDAKLTPKQEKFAQCVASGMTQADAYRNSFNVRAGTKDTTIHVSACEIAADPKVALRIEQIRKPIVQKAQITLESHLEELRVLRELAKDSSQLSAAITAEVSRGKASGHYTEKVEHTGKDGGAIEHKMDATLAPTDAYLKMLGKK
jgi:phage terminase small subunit